ncbi:hypothetical protein ACIHCX_03275 [Streptomyces sp. NPDC052043]|uniref:hypothetical protein n=1 Tax=Streptomyces sp. NPDC052043 TaxID=3365684 RepID=UPI0037D37562
MTALIPTAPLPPASLEAKARLEQRLAPELMAAMVSRSADVSATCRRLSATAVTSADFDQLLCVQDELAMCRCRIEAAS